MDPFDFAVAYVLVVMRRIILWLNDTWTAVGGVDVLYTMQTLFLIYCVVRFLLVPLLPQYRLPSGIGLPAPKGSSDGARPDNSGAPPMDADFEQL